MSYLFRSLAATGAAIFAATTGCQIIGGIFSPTFAVIYSIGWALLVALLWALVARPRPNP